VQHHYHLLDKPSTAAGPASVSSNPELVCPKDRQPLHEPRGTPSYTGYQKPHLPDKLCRSLPSIAATAALTAARSDHMARNCPVTPVFPSYSPSTVCPSVSRYESQLKASMLKATEFVFDKR